MTLDEYENGGRTLYSEFAEAVAAILQASIAEHSGLRLQNIQRRAKEPASLRVKLTKAGAANNAQIADFAKDVSGCRLIFYTNGDVYRFGQSGILRENFTIDYERSKIHYPDNKEEGAEFFISENWVVTLSEARCALSEYRRFAGLRCEIQVQTILDHAWAEMAHDTIYKPMSDVGFGAAKIEGMRKRLRKVMQEFLQPAGYAFDKIASDYAQLRDGIEMFDSDALGVIAGCADRNALDDAVERFSNYVLPNYDDYIAAAPEIIEVLSNAVIRAPRMLDIPHKAYGHEYPGTKSQAIIAKICRILESGYLLYAAPERMFDALIAMRSAAVTDDERKPIDDLIRRFAQHDLRAWKQVGPGLQRLLVDKIAALDDAEFLARAPSVTIMLREALSSTVTGTSWKADAMLLHSGSVSVTDDLKAVRRQALHELERLHVLLDDDAARKDVRHAMLAAGNTPNNSGYSDLLGEVIMNDLTHVFGFFTKMIPGFGLEARRQLETELHRKFYAYHVLPPGMADNAQLAAAHARLLEAFAACRAALEGDLDFDRYRMLVGHDSVTRSMWEKPGFDYEASTKDRSSAIEEMVASVTAKTADEWLARLERFVVTESNDGAFFFGLQEFIKKLAHANPEILLDWVPKLSDRLATWLPGMLHDLSEAGQGAAIDPLIETWVSEDRHLSSIAYYLQFAAAFRLDLLLAITGKGLASGEELVLHNVAIAAARQSAKHNEPMFDEVFLPAVRVLSARKLFGWAGGMFNWNQVSLLRGLSTAQTEALLGLLLDLPRLGSNGEAMLAVLAEENIQAVIDFIGQRFQHEHDGFEVSYENLPHGLYYLKDPLAAAPVEIVAAARAWFDRNRSLSEFRGGRLIAELFPNLEHPLYPLLLNHIEESRDGIEFVLSVLRAYEGQTFLHPLLRAIVGILPPDDELLRIVDIVIDSSGVLVGDYGSVEAQEARRALVAEWETDESEAVRAFAATFVKAADNQLAMERRRADRSVALRRIEFGDDGD
ncbi:RelA/SpoT domain-containing protein [Sphingomonas abietis]|uniref:RelA/SpoT domain-containing protein n=1 Tax=Sphingomonas abietis TaxID=3012344 RepID=A0ABY7NKJ6_9SPHN|nr:RelA/SpoT domain-containing protein [Sphingomonas abietis]WBO21767.1 RelA/SpoT domain-containing protein [Sphingomonas abietis]